MSQFEFQQYVVKWLEKYQLDVCFIHVAWIHLRGLRLRQSLPK